MKKVLICFLLLTCVLSCMLPVYAAEAEVTVEVRASKNNVQVGDSVEYTVLATGSGVVAMQFHVMMPDGLRYVPDSGKVPENLAKKLGVPVVDWTENSMMFTFYNDTGVTFAKGTEILRFSCVAEKDGNWDVIIHELLPFDSEFLDFSPVLKVQTLRVGSMNQDQVPSGNGETMPDASHPTATGPSSALNSTEEPAVDVIVKDPAEQNGDHGLPATKPATDAEDGTQSEQPQKTKPKSEGKIGPWLVPVTVVAVADAALLLFLLIKKKIF